MANFSALPEGTELVGDYRIGRVLGAGGFGVTYLAEEIALGRKVTIKEYFPSDFAARGEGLEAIPRSEHCRGDYQWGLDRFIEEAQTLARFDHPNIVRVYRYFRANNTGYMVLHFEEGQSLKGWLKSLGRAPRQTELDGLLPPILEALELIHKSDFLHRDIAPDNIMIRKNGVPVLIDFGSARGEIAAHSKTVSALVKPGYSPYEQYAERSSQQGPWTDIYALGATLYHAVTGRRPPDAPSRMVKDDMMPARDAAIAAYRATFLRAIDRALALAIESRPQSIVAWRGDLLAPEPAPAKGGNWRRGRDAKRDKDDEPPLVKPGVVLAGSAMPPPPDAPGPQGGLLDFVDDLKRKKEPALADAGEQPRAAPSGAGAAPAAAAMPAAAVPGAPTAKLDNGPPPAPSFFWRRKEKAAAEAAASVAAPRVADAAQPAAAPPAPEQPAVDPAVAAATARAAKTQAGKDADKEASKEPAAKEAKQAKPSKASKPSKAKSAPAADAKAAAPAAETLPVPVPDKAADKRRPAPRPKPIKSREPSRLRPLLVKLAIGAGIASAAVAMQNRFPGVDTRPALVTNQTAASSKTQGIAAQPVLAAELKGHQGAVQALVASDDGQLLVSAGSDATLKVWNATSGRLVRTVALPEGQATALALSGHRAVTGHGDGRLVIWDLDRAERLGSFRRNEAAIWAVTFLGSADRFAASSHDWKVAIWDVKSPQAPAHILEGHDNAVQALAYAPKSEQLASGGADRTVKLWSLESLDLVRTYKGQKDFVTALAFSGDGKTLAAAGLDGAVRLMPSTSSRHNRTLTGHSGRIGAVAFAPGDATRLATASEDGSVRLWDAKQGRTQRTLTGLGGPVRTLAFLPDGNRLATAGDDGIVRVWSLGPARAD